MHKHKTLWLFMLVIFTLAACSSPATPEATEAPAAETVVAPTLAPPDPEPTQVPTEVPTEASEAYPPPVPTVSGYPAPTENPAAYPAPVEDTPAAPVAVTFASADGTQLTGTFYAPMSTPAPIVVLMHQFGSDQHQWDEIARWLQTGTPAEGNTWLPAMPSGLKFAVLTFDFRGHGASEGNSADDAGLLLDAQSAVAFAQTQPGVDALRVITIGTSIGADGAVDACIQLNGNDIAETQTPPTCVGALALSPGSFLGVNYTQAATTFVNEPYFAAVYCLAADGDSSAPILCDSVTGNRYKSVIYPGNAHGMSLLTSGLDPNIGDVLLEFLVESLQLPQ
ncbi:MAG: hypothetical protein HUU38_19655 [Anaerolineales bacterium]|nr:hypothetical protein [Anaerolineales bacterium]